MNIFDNLKDKKILVTGHTGFKGSWLVHILSRYTGHICGFALAPSTSPDLYSISGVKKKLESEYIGDISQYGRINDCIREFDPDVVFHLAAQPLVRQSYMDPIGTFTVNAIGSANLLESIRRNVQKKCSIICITTDKVYQNDETGRPFIEDDKLGGYDPYSASKAAMEIIVDSYIKSFFNPADCGVGHNIQIAACRAGNVVGGGDFSNDRLMVDIMKALCGGKEIMVRNPTSVRPWQHVLEPLFGYMELAARMEAGVFSGYGHAWNFGPESSSQKNVEYIVKKAIELNGSGSYFVHADQSAPHEAGCLMLDISKAKARLGWKPRYSVDQAIAKTVEWYKAFYAGKDCNAVMEKQIEEYFGE